MLTIGLSVSGSIKLLERRLMLRMKSINKMAKEVVYSMAPAVAVADVQTAVADKLQPLGVAKTTLPDERLGFTQTFQHIRFELEALYKEQNPIFTNTAVPELWATYETTAAKKKQSNFKLIDATLESSAAVSGWDATTPALWISKTILPDERLDFNQTFSRVRHELEALYKAQNPNFTSGSMLAQEAEYALPASGKASTEGAESADSARPGRSLEPLDRNRFGERSFARQAMPVA
jgi:hypothetical protein